MNKLIPSKCKVTFPEKLIYNSFYTFLCWCSCVIHLWWHWGSFKWSTPSLLPSALHFGPSTPPTLLWSQVPLPHVCVTLDIWVAWKRIDACSSVWVWGRVHHWYMNYVNIGLCFHSLLCTNNSSSSEYVSNHLQFFILLFILMLIELAMAIIFLVFSRKVSKGLSFFHILITESFLLLTMRKHNTFFAGLSWAILIFSPRIKKKKNHLFITNLHSSL